MRTQNIYRFQRQFIPDGKEQEARMTKSTTISKQVLLIEDDDLIRETIAELLSISRYKVTIATNGVEGLEQAKKQTPDIILCDVMMPEMNGFELIGHIKNDPILKHVPFLFMSARSREEDEQQGLQLGADGYLFKPFSNYVLLDKLYTLLKEH